MPPGPAVQVPLQERYGFVEDGGVAGRCHVVRDNQGEPEEVVRDPRPDPAPGGGMPPVLHITRRELPCCCAEDLRPRLLGSPVNQGHDVLELVSKAVRAPRLEEPRDL